MDSVSTTLNSDSNGVKNINVVKMYPLGYKGTKMREHITPVLMHLHWLPVKFCIDYKILLFTYKGLNGLAPNYISDMIKPVVHSRTLRSCSKVVLHVPKTKSVTYGERGFSHASPTLWNKLPENLQKSDSVDIFKGKLKTYLFKKAFNVD